MEFVKENKRILHDLAKNNASLELIEIQVVIFEQNLRYKEKPEE